MRQSDAYVQAREDDTQAKACLRRRRASAPLSEPEVKGATQGNRAAL